jgi:hypothetical protein
MPLQSKSRASLIFLNSSCFLYPSKNRYKNNQTRNSVPKTNEIKLRVRLKRIASMYVLRERDDDDDDYDVCVPKRNDGRSGSFSVSASEAIFF